MEHICWQLFPLVSASASAALAGGFQINIEAPDSSDAELKGAALLVRTYGCHQPWDAEVSATAEGMVDGKRQSMKIELTRTSKGVYAIRKQWASKGVWVVAITDKTTASRRARSSKWTQTEGAGHEG